MTKPAIPDPPRGIAAWLLALPHTAAVGALAVLVCLRTDPAHLTVTAAAAFALLTWSVVRPDGWGLALLAIAAGAWWVADWGTATTADAVAVGALLVAGHHGAAFRAHAPARARIAWSVLVRLVGVHLLLVLAAVVVMLLVVAASGGSGGGWWRLVWPTVAFASLVALVGWVLRPR
ncbi:MAG: hypothetical protein Q4F65_02550 [Propionibacteriaceae bacterium]|nr:hypothetical protein [Propionibacteriaceae bacterium]